MKPPHLEQPIYTLLLSESMMAFGRTLVNDSDGNYKGPLMLSLKEGYVLKFFASFICLSDPCEIVIGCLKLLIWCREFSKKITPKKEIWLDCNKAAYEGLCLIFLGNSLKTSPTISVELLTISSQTLPKGYGDNIYYLFIKTFGVWETEGWRFSHFQPFAVGYNHFSVWHQM